MGLGDILNGTDEWINRTIGNVIPAYGDYLKKDAARIAQEKAAGEHPSLFKTFSRDASQLMYPVNKAIDAVPGAHFLLDLPSRSWDSLFITAAHSAAVGYRETGNAGHSDWGQFFNRDVWSRAWDSWGDPNHVSAGAIISSRLNAREGAADARAVYGADPLDAANAKAIQDAADNTWYGSVAGGAADLAASMTLPGGGVVAKAAKAARATGEIKSAAHAEQIAQHFAKAGAEGVSHSAFGDTLVGMVGRDANPDSYISRMQKFARATDGMDRVSLMDHLSPVMEHSSDTAKATIANVWADANKLEDATLRDQVKINSLLALQGSKTAREALIADAPLLAVNLQRMTGAPQAVALFEDLRAARLGEGEATVNQILDQHYNTKADYAELDALREALQKAELDAKAARDLRAQTRAGKPTLQNFDGQRLQEVRASSQRTVQELRDQVQRAKADYEGSKRWASAAFKKGEIQDVADFHANLGDKRQRLLDLQDQLAQARQDHTLFHSTPLPGWEDLAQWRDQMAGARGAAKDANVQRDWAEALYRQQKDVIARKRAERLAITPGLNSANDMLNSIFDLGTSEIATGRVAPTALDRLKAHLRDQVGQEYYFSTGDGNRLVRAIQAPTREAKIALAPRARGSISLVEADLGRRQLSDALKRSGVYDPAEIRQAANDLIATPAGRRQDVVSKHQEQMLERIALKHFPDMEPADALKHAKELTKATVKNFGDGRAWTTRRADEQAGKGRILVDGPDGETVAAFDEPMLRSELADNAPLMDPEEFDHLIREHIGGIRANLRQGRHMLADANDMLTTAWKHGALLRPGLAVRASLDTELRAMALLDTGENLANAIRGSANLLRNTKTRILERTMLGAKDPGSAGVKILSMDLQPVRVGKDRFVFSQDALAREANMMAATKGGSITGSLHPQVQKRLGKYQVDRTSWDRYKAGSPNWGLAYMEYDKVLQASPTARWLSDTKFSGGDVSGPDLLAGLRKEPDVMAEYRKIAQPEGRSFEEFVQSVAHEVDSMYPSQDVLNAARNGRLSERYLEQQFPREARFDVPGPEMSAVQGRLLTRKAKSAVNGMYRTFLDKPDMWFSRNPTMAAIYRREVKAQYADVLARTGEKQLTAEDIRLIDKRARNEAISTVRKTFFDTTRWNGAHHAVSRISPFFAAWEDAMMSWSRLIYDDPRRLVKLQAGYNSFGTLNPYLPKPLLIDQNGNPVRRGQEADQTYIAVPFKVGHTQMRIRREALNSIAQGDVWWLPGFGPQATLATTALLGKAVPNDVALSIVGTENPLGKQLLRSMYLGGELPKSDTGSLVMSTMPGYVRNIANDVLGVNHTRNTMVGFNKRVADALSRGETVNDARMKKFMAEAAHDATVAGIVRIVSGAGLGMTGTAAVDGQFYVDRMHEIEGMSPQALKAAGFDTPEEYFTHLYPDAGELNWHLSKNETGVAATVNAQSSASHLNSISKDYLPEVGWMVVGADNLGGEFSRTAYNQQFSDGGRTNKTPAEMQQDAQAAVGWKRYSDFLTLLEDAAKKQGLSMDSDIVRQAKTAYIAGLQGENSAWAKDWNSRENKAAIYLNQAQKMSADPRLRNRADMAAFRTYMENRQFVLDHFGIKSMTGTSPERQQARAVMRQVGEQLAADNLGFQQMWQRFLSKESEE